MFSKVEFLIPTIFLTVAGALGSTLFLFKKEDKELSAKVFILYSLAVVLGFALTGLSGFMTVEKPVSFFEVLQFIFFAFGCLNAYAIYKTESWSEPESFVHEFIFTLYLAILGAFSFMVVFLLTNKEGYALVFAPAAILFMVPFMVMKCFDFMLMIPDEVYPKWYHPGGEIGEIPDEMLDDSNIVIVEFRMNASVADETEIVKSKTKLPLKMELGKFFPVFLDAYNDRNPGHQIQFFDENKQPYAWNFYVQPKWWQFKTYINPETTVRENNIGDNFVIIAERV